MDSEWIVKFTVQMDCPVVGQILYYLKEWDFDEFILAIEWFIWVDILCAGPISCYCIGEFHYALISLFGIIKKVMSHVTTVSALVLRNNVWLLEVCWLLYYNYEVG